MPNTQAWHSIGDQYFNNSENGENSGPGEFGLVTPTPGQLHTGHVVELVLRYHGYTFIFLFVRCLLHSLDVVGFAKLRNKFAFFVTPSCSLCSFAIFIIFSAIKGILELVKQTPK